MSHVVALHSAGSRTCGRWRSSPGLYPEATRLLAVPEPLPRTYVVGASRVADGVDAFRVLLDRSGRSHARGAAARGAGRRPRPRASPATAASWPNAPIACRLEATLSAPGYVVLLDSYAPGWRARVDGRDGAGACAPTWPSARWPCPPGTHRIEYVYRPALDAGRPRPVGGGRPGGRGGRGRGWPGEPARAPAVARETGLSRETLEEHRRLWAAKPALRDVYAVWFDALLAAIGPAATSSRSGAGPGFFAAHARGATPRRRWLAADVVPAGWNDLAADATNLPFRAGAFDAIAAVDLVHHLADPAGLFEEARRVLRPGGRLVAVEPWVTPLSFPVYRWLHQEGCRLGLDPWRPFGAAGGRREGPVRGGRGGRVVAGPQDAARTMGRARVRAAAGDGASTDSRTCRRSGSARGRSCPRPPGPAADRARPVDRAAGALDRPARAGRLAAAAT